MAIYWMMLLLPSILAVARGPRGSAVRGAQVWGFPIVFLVFSMIIGLRFQVGADWEAYQEMVDFLTFADVGDALDYGDPAFSLSLLLSTKLGWDIYLPSCLSAMALMYGLLRFCRHQPDPWLALCAAVPYLIIVVGMGYIRQATAIGFILLALLEMERGSVARFVLLIFVAALFHATALMMLPLGGLALVRKVWVMAAGVLVTLLLYQLLLADRMAMFRDAYIENLFEMDSSGALVRQAMNAVPATLYLIFGKRSGFPRALNIYWTATALLSIAFFFVAMFTTNTTLIDRIGLYLTPIQVMVAGNISQWMATSENDRRFLTVGVLAFYGATLFVWLNYATHSEFWVPYRFMPFML